MMISHEGWFYGVVQKYSTKMDEYKVLYDDGDTSWELAEDLVFLDIETQSMLLYISYEHSLFISIS